MLQTFMISYLSAIFLSAFLLFQLQPIIARYILPWYGGGPAIWTSCMMFFQIALLLGYFYAHVLSSYTPVKRQPVLHLSLLALSLLFLPIGPPNSWIPDGSGQPGLQILLLLSLSVGAPFVLISASGPLLQSWFAGVFKGQSPFRLYALSNLGSLTALLSYPILVEPRLAIDSQANIWSILFVVLVLLFAACGVAFAKAGKTDIERIEESKPRPVTALDRTLWILLAACGSAMLLAVTNQISQDVAVVPFLWILPLSIYLITFIITFERDGWYIRWLWLGALAVSLAFLTRLMFLHFSYDAGTLGYQVTVFCVALFTCCMVCHGELARRRSSVPYLTTFYLYVALGGAIGGIFVNIIAPLLFSGYWELHIALTGTLILAGVCIYFDNNILNTKKRRRAFAGAWYLGVLMFATLMIEQVQIGRVDSIHVERSFFGVIYVDEFDIDTRDHERHLYHGKIRHGLQLIHPSRQHLATAYYGVDTGVAAALQHHPRRYSRSKSERGVNVGVIGLGVGTLSIYGKEQDSFRYYEIDPAVENIAREYFTYLDNTEADTTVILGDARISMQRELDNSGSNAFDVLVLDAFSGDAIPVHLLTNEAFDLYAQHLRAGGIVAVHITNQYIDLSRVVRTAAARLGMTAIWIDDDGSNHFEDSNDWVLLTENSRFIEAGAVRAIRADWHDADFVPVEWTDDFNNLVELLEWGE